MHHLSPIPQTEDHRSVLVWSGDDTVKPCGEASTWVSSTIRCMSEATENPYDFILIQMTKRSSEEIPRVLELCANLKKNRHSRAIPIAVLLHSANRQLIQQLKQAGADYVKIQNTRNQSARADESHPPSDCLDQAEPIDQVLLRLCPHIHYSPIDAGRELVTCGAYADWLVLGPRTLKTLCETPRHRTCSYYQSPKLRA